MWPTQRAKCTDQAAGLNDHMSVTHQFYDCFIYDKSQFTAIIHLCIHKNKLLLYFYEILYWWEKKLIRHFTFNFLWIKMRYEQECKTELNLIDVRKIFVWIAWYPLGYNRDYQWTFGFYLQIYTSSLYINTLNVSALT